jgi:hypothetical protein
MRIHVKCLSYIWLNIDKHLSLSFLLLSFKPSLLLKYTSASLIKLLILRRLGPILKIIFILIIKYFHPSLVTLPDIMQL